MESILLTVRMGIATGITANGTSEVDKWGVVELSAFTNMLEMYCNTRVSNQNRNVSSAIEICLGPNLSSETAQYRMGL